jgi:hypothetical protein
MTPYKNRGVNKHLPVEIYRNLHRGGYSVRQEGLVVGHTDNATLLDAEFIVSEPGRRRVVVTGVRNVHAWVRGTLVTTREQTPLVAKVRYNPKSDAHFTYIEPDQKGWCRATNARLVVFRKDGVTAWQVNDW